MKSSYVIYDTSSGLYFKGTELHRDGEFLTAMWTPNRDQAMQWTWRQDALFSAYDHFGMDYAKKTLEIQEVA